MMKQLDFWPLALKLAQPARTLCAPSVGVGEQESRAYGSLARSRGDSTGPATAPLAGIGLGPPEVVPGDLYYNPRRQEFFRVPLSTLDKRKSGGSTNGLISQQLSLPLREYCMCLNLKERTGLCAVQRVCIEAGCCVALPPV